VERKGSKFITPERVLRDSSDGSAREPRDGLRYLGRAGNAG